MIDPRVAIGDSITLIAFESFHQDADMIGEDGVIIIDKESILALGSS
jgi:hypothetical protein